MAELIATLILMLTGLGYIIQSRGSDKSILLFGILTLISIILCAKAEKK